MQEGGREGGGDYIYQYKKVILMMKSRISHWNKNAKIIETKNYLNGIENENRRKLVNQKPPKLISIKCSHLTSKSHQPYTLENIFIVQNKTIRMGKFFDDGINSITYSSSRRLYTKEERMQLTSHNLIRETIKLLRKE